MSRFEALKVGGATCGSFRALNTSQQLVLSRPYAFGQFLARAHILLSLINVVTGNNEDGRYAACAHTRNYSP